MKLFFQFIAVALAFTAAAQAIHTAVAGDKGEKTTKETVREPGI
jgi:hypothetical protein